MSGEQLTGPWRAAVSDSPYMSADLFEPGAKPVVLTIKSVQLESPVNPATRKEEQRPGVSFAETKLRFILNISKSRAIAAIAGTNKLEKWPGTKISLQRGTTKLRGQVVACIDVVAPAPPKSDG